LRSLRRMELEEQEHTAESHAAFMAAIAVADAADAVDAAARAAARDADRARAVRAADELAITRAANAQLGGFGVGGSEEAVVAQLREMKLSTRTSASVDAQRVCRWRRQRLGGVVPGPRFVYEKQVDHLCAVHSVNSLLYARVVGADDMAAVWRLMPFLECTGEMHRLLSPALRELPNLAATRAALPEESRRIGYTMTTTAMMLMVVGYRTRQVFAGGVCGLDAAGWAAQVRNHGGVPGCIVHTRRCGGHYMVFLPCGDGFRAVDALGRGYGGASNRGNCVDGGVRVTELADEGALYSYVRAEQDANGAHNAIMAVMGGPAGWVAPDHPLSTIEAAVVAAAAREGERERERERKREDELRWSRQRERDAEAKRERLLRKVREQVFNCQCSSCSDDPFVSRFGCGRRRLKSESVKRRRRR